MTNVPKREEKAKMKRVVYLVAMMVLAAIAAGPMAAQANPFVGTWKLNVPKSKYEGALAPKNLTRTVTAEGSSLKYSFEGEAADGSKISYSFTSKLDGSDSAVTGVGMPGGADTVVLSKLSAHKITGVTKKDGKELGKVLADLSTDGKTVTVKTRGKIDGKEVKAEQVYDKQ
jgi:hypothetical protein